MASDYINNKYGIFSQPESTPHLSFNAPNNATQSFASMFWDSAIAPNQNANIDGQQMLNSQLNEMSDLRVMPNTPVPTPSFIDSNRGIPQGTGGGIFDLSAPTAPSAPAVGTAAVTSAQPTSTAWGGVGGTQMPSQFQTRDQLVQWQQANGLTPDGLYGDKSAAKFAELNSPTTGTSMLDGYTQAGNAMSYAGVNNLSGAGMETPVESGSMFDSLKSAVGLESMTNTDLLGMGGSILQGGLGAYGMFKNLDQMDTRLDQGQQQIDLSRDEYEENLRHRKSIVNQNKGA